MTQNLWKQIQHEINHQLQSVRPFVALADGESGGLVTIRRVTELTAEGESYARMAGFTFDVDAEIICLMVGGKPLPLGLLQRSTPSGYAFPVSIDAPGFSINGAALSATAEQSWRYILANPGASTLTTVGMPAPTTSGSLSNDDNADGPWIDFSSGAVSGNTAGINGPDAYHIEWGDGIDISFVWRTGGNLNNTRYWVGIADGSLSGDTDPAQHVAAFNREAHTNWQAYTNDGTSGGTFTDTGVAIATDTIATMRIFAEPSQVRFWLNGTLVATHSTNIPGSTTPMRYTWFCQTLSNFDRDIYLQRMWMQE